MAVSEDLLEWCKRFGVAAEGIQVSFVSEGWRGVVATKHISTGDCILSVPRNLLMSVESAKAQPWFASVASRHPHLTSSQLLSIHLLHEVTKGRSSFWWPYLESLPKSYTTAIYYKPEDIAALQVPYAIQAAQTEIQRAHIDYNTALPLLKELNITCTWDDWIWAASTLSSRTMYLPSDAAGCLTPFGDLHNYGPPPPFELPQRFGRMFNTSHSQYQEKICGDGMFDTANDVYKIIARKEYCPGEQVLLCYGQHTNLDLLLYYGFLLDPDCITTHDKAFLDKQLFPPCAMVEADFYVHGNGVPSWDTLFTLRTHLCSNAKGFRSKAFAGEPISRENEVQVAESIKRACGQMLDSLLSTVEEDEELLLKGGQHEVNGTEGRMKWALMWRLSYKKMLRATIALCTQIMTSDNEPFGN